MHLDYKRDLPGDKDAEKKEFLADVTSFANAGGGDIVFGIVEDADAATFLRAVISSDANARLLSFEPHLFSLDSEVNLCDVRRKEKSHGPIENDA